MKSGPVLGISSQHPGWTIGIPVSEAEYGANALVEKKGRPTWRLFVDQFTSPMILVLIGAAAIVVAGGNWMLAEFTSYVNKLWAAIPTLV